MQLKDTAERILAVDCAAAMVEEMLKQGQNLQAVGSTFHPFSNGTKVWLHAWLASVCQDVFMINTGFSLNQGIHALSMSVFLGFDADPSLNIAARIRGPNVSSLSFLLFPNPEKLPYLDGFFSVFVISRFLLSPLYVPKICIRNRLLFNVL